MNQRGKVILLLFFFSVCLSAALFHHHREMREGALKPAELYSVLHQQFRACRARDFSSAYTQVSARFQAHLTLPQFSVMIQSDYARMLKAERMEFGAWQCWGQRAVVQVYFIGGDGAVFPCVYTLVNEQEGWKIDSARWVKGWPAGQRMAGVRC